MQGYFSSQEQKAPLVHLTLIWQKEYVENQMSRIFNSADGHSLTYEIYRTIFTYEENVI